MTTRTNAGIEAGARALCRVMFSSVAFDTLPASTQTELRRWSETCLTAADAAAAPDVDPDTTIIFDAPVVGVTAAAPAVGVSNRVTANELVVAYGKAAIAWSKDTSNQSLGDAMDAAKHRVIDALLTAQPEPGTHDDAGRRGDGMSDERETGRSEADVDAFYDHAH